MCVSYSGRCLLSNYMTGRDASRGACAQPCRYKYALMEEKRPGEYFPIGEDEGGAFILNSRDMCMIDHIPALAAAGLSSLKIEGRAKSAYYAAIVTAAYRHAIDAAAAGRPLEKVWRDEVEKVSHRPYSTGFYFGEPGHRRRPVHKRLSGGGGGGVLRRQRPRALLPAQQVRRRGRAGAGGAGRAGYSLQGSCHDGYRRLFSHRAPHTPDAVLCGPPGPGPAPVLPARLPEELLKA